MRRRSAGGVLIVVLAVPPRQAGQHPELQHAHGRLAHHHGKVLHREADGQQVLFFQAAQQRQGIGRRAGQGFAAGGDVGPRPLLHGEQLLAADALQNDHAVGPRRQRPAGCRIGDQGGQLTQVLRGEKTQPAELIGRRLLAIAGGDETPRPGRIESRQASAAGNQNEHRLILVGQPGIAGEFADRFDLSPQGVVAGEGNCEHRLARRRRRRLRQAHAWAVPQQNDRQHHRKQLSHGILLFEGLFFEGLSRTED